MVDSLIDVVNIWQICLCILLFYRFTKIRKQVSYDLSGIW